MRPLAPIALALCLIMTACGDDDTAATGGSTTSAPPESTSAPSTSAAPTTSAAPSTTPTVASTTTEAGGEAAPSIMLDDADFAEEPPDTSYRVQLLFRMEAQLDDGTVQEGQMTVDGGKLLDPETHSLVVDAEGLTNVPGCFDIASTPGFVSAYHTFYGGLSGDTGGDLTGEAFLYEPGITSNGIIADRYEITLANVQGNAESEYDSFTEAYIDIARDGGFVVSLVLIGTGRNNTFTVDQTEPRSIEYRLDFSDFGTIAEFTTPAGCN